MICVVSTKSNAPFKRYVRVNRRKIGLVRDAREATRFNRWELVQVLARIHSILPSCHFECEELVSLAEDWREKAEPAHNRSYLTSRHEGTLSPCFGAVRERAQL